MKEWKVFQEIYHRLASTHSDDLNNVDIHFSENIVEDALLHFSEHVEDWIYPAKSYFVAICYAYWISVDFGEDFYDLLNDEKLLYGNDPYFVPYAIDKQVYDNILKNVIFPIPMIGMVPDVKKYYDEEIGFGLL